MHAIDFRGIDERRGRERANTFAHRKTHRLITRDAQNIFARETDDNDARVAHAFRDALRRRERKRSTKNGAAAQELALVRIEERERAMARGRWIWRTRRLKTREERSCVIGCVRCGELDREWHVRKAANDFSRYFRARRRSAKIPAHATARVRRRDRRRHAGGPRRSKRRARPRFPARRGS